VGITADMTTSGDQALLCRVRRVICAIPIRHVIETMRVLPIEPLLGAPDAVVGVALIRGEPTPVVDAGLLFGAPCMPTRLVTVRAGTRVVALAVDEVLGIRGILDGAAHALPPLLGTAAGGAVEAIGVADRELMLVLETIRLVPPEAIEVAV
jgi:purine-binding chemotaxis protein CheW